MNRIFAALNREPGKPARNEDGRTAEPFEIYAAVKSKTSAAEVASSISIGSLKKNLTARSYLLNEPERIKTQDPKENNCSEKLRYRTEEESCLDILP